MSMMRLWLRSRPSWGGVEPHLGPADEVVLVPKYRETEDAFDVGENDVLVLGNAMDVGNVVD